jgi:hypothetical protein
MVDPGGLGVAADPGGLGIVDGGRAGPTKGGRGEEAGGLFNVADETAPDETGRTPGGPVSAGLAPALVIGPDAGRCDKAGRAETFAGLGVGLGTGLGTGLADEVPSGAGRAVDDAA